jgi:methylmalonyl-CoA/ethylmalonyl-CoA epimerase
MLEKARFHHIGIAVNSIAHTSAIYQTAGYQLSDTTIETIQNVRIAFLTKAGSPLLELVEPIDIKSPVYNILKKVGVSAYHFCYEVENLQMEIAEMENKGFRLMVTPVATAAFANRQICFLYHLDAGLIELLEK